MAKKKSKRFQFELGIPGLIFVTGLLICLFLWMFILGFWLGQKMVATKAREAASPIAQKALKEKRIRPPLVTEEVNPPQVVPEKGAEKEAPPEETLTTKTAARSKPLEKQAKAAPTSQRPPKGKEVSREEAQNIKISSKEIPVIKQKAPPAKFYTLQVASFRSPKEAQKYARFLGSRGYEALVKRVVLPKKGIWYRIYVGRFKTFQEAKEFGTTLQKKEKIKTYYITRIEE